MISVVRSFIYLVLLVALSYGQLYGQKSVGVGTTNPNPNSIMDLSTTDKGFLMPRMTQAQRNAIPTGAAEEGMLVYDNTNDNFYYWDNAQSQWVAIPASSSDDQNIQGSGLSGTQLTIGIENGTNETVNLSSIDTDNQDIQGSGLSGNTLTIGIQNGSNETVDLSAINTDDQNINGSSFSSGTNQLTIDIENGGSETVDLSSLDNTGTDDQNIQGSGLSGNTLTIGIENGSNQTVNLGSIDTDNQDLGSSSSGTNRTITITNGSNTSIDVADNDNDPSNEYQDLSGSTSGNTATVSIGNGTNASFSIADNDADPTNEYNTNLTLNGNTLELTDGGGTETADLSSLGGGGDNDWDRSGGEMYPSNLGDQVGVGTSFPNEDFEVDDADGDGTATLQIGSVEELIDGGANLMEVPNSDLLVSDDNLGVGNVDNDYRLYVGDDSRKNSYFDVDATNDIIINGYSGFGEGSILTTVDIFGYVGNPDSAFWRMNAYDFINQSARSKKNDIHSLKGKDYQELMTDIEDMELAFYRYKKETKNLDPDMPAKYRPAPHIGTFTDAAPDYIQDNTFSGISIYGFSALGMAGVKYLNEETEKLKNKVEKLQTTIEDFGSSKIQNNQQVKVTFSKTFSSKLQNQKGNQPIINLTPRSANAGLFIKEKDKSGFVVATSNQAKNASFDWVAKAKVDVPKQNAEDQRGSDLKSKLNLDLSQKEKSRLDQYLEKKQNQRDQKGNTSKERRNLSKKEEMKLEMKRAKKEGDTDIYEDLQNELQYLQEN